MNQVNRFLAGPLGRKWLAAASALLLATGFSVAHAQDNSIDAITTTQQGPNLVVKITMKVAPANPPASFSVASPARVALDFPGTSNNLGKTTVDANQGELRSINVVQSGDRTRLVLNLKRVVAYTTAVEGNSVLVSLAPTLPESAAAAPANTSTRFAEGNSSSSHNLRDVDFRRGPNGEGRVIVDLSDNQTGVDIKTQGQTIVVDFQKTGLPETLHRRLNVADFATPVQSINTFTQGDTTRMVIEPKGLWEHNAYQTDNRLVIEVKPVKEDPNKLFQGSRVGYKGERLSLNFQNVEVRSLLQVIADFTNLNIITSDSVGGNLTLRLKDVPWDQALDIILQAKGLDMRKNGNVILVAPKDELASKEKLDLEAKAQIGDLEPLRSEVFQLNYQKADTMRAFLTGDGAGASGGGSSAKVLSKRGSASADARTNQLFVQDTAAKLDQIRAVIARIDVASRQVLIEARIVVADDGFSRQLGAKLGYTDSNANGSPVVGNVRTNIASSYGALDPFKSGTSNVAGFLPTGLSVDPTTGVVTGNVSVASTSTVTTANGPFVSLPANGIAQTAALALSFFRAGSSKALNLELSALESDNHGKVVSSPRVVTADQVKAVIEQGTELPYQVATSSGATSIQFQKANLRLEVTPQDYARRQPDPVG